MIFYKIKLKVIPIGLLLLFITTNFSCKKALDNQLINGTYENAYWKTESDVNSAVLGGYALLRKSLLSQNAFFLWGDAPTGIFTSDEANNKYPYEGKFRVPYKEAGTTNWTNWYQVVGVANLVLEKIQTIPDDKFADGRKNYLMGEAYFLRSLAYFYMTRVWGDLQLQLTAITSADQAGLTPRIDEATILKQITADATKASALLTWDGLNENLRVRASKVSALALLSHVSAWQNDYAKTVLYTDSIINRTDLVGLQSKGTIRNVFKNTTSLENILVIPMKNSDNEASNSSSVAFITIGSGLITGMPNDAPTYFITAEKVNSLYEKTDARRTEFIGFRNTSDLKPCLMKYGDIINVASGQGNFDLRAESSLIIFRLADIILLKSEALNALNRDGEALTELNKIRARSGVANINNSGILLKREIVLERQRELIGEGQNYFDMIRNSRSYNAGGATFYPAWMTVDRFNDRGWQWPVNNDLINANRLIAQNKFWQNN